MNGSEGREGSISRRLPGLTGGLIGGEVEFSCDQSKSAKAPVRDGDLGEGVERSEYVVGERVAPISEGEEGSEL